MNPIQFATNIRDSGFPQDSKLLKVTRETVLHIPLLSEISEEEIELLLKELRICQYPRREMIINKGCVSDSLLFLIAGQLQVTDVTKNGKEVGLRILAPGDFFGEIGVINGGVRSAFVNALSDSIVAFLPRATALHLFFHSPTVADKLMRRLAEKVQQDSEFRSLLSIQNSSKRVCALLQLLATELNPAVHVINQIPTHQGVAIMVNTSRETVTRTLLMLTQRGIVQKDAHRLIIRKPAELHRLAQDDT